MSRPCGWCHHRERTTLERRVLQGEPIALVSADAGYSESAAYRHLRAHVRPELRTALADRGVSASAADFGVRHRQLLDETASVREYARRSNDPRLLLAAVQQESEVLKALALRLGIDSDETLTDLRDGRALAQACARVLAQSEVAISAVTEDLRAAGCDELATALGGAVERRIAIASSPKERLA